MMEQIESKAKQIVNKSFNLSEFEIDEAIKNYVRDIPKLKSLESKGFKVGMCRINYEISGKDVLGARAIFQLIKEIKG